MALTEEHATWFAKTFSMIVENVAKALLGKEEVNYEIGRASCRERV